MIQPAYRFYLNGTQYERTFLRAVSFLSASLLLAIVALSLGVWLWSGYPHTFTPYLKWRDALVALLWSLAFVCLGGGVIVFRFLFALRSGYKEGMVTLTGDNVLLVRDLSHENLASVFWMMNSAFWCFVAMLVGLTPEILFQWTLHLPNVVLAVITTGLAAILGLAGLVVSIVAAVFVFIGCVGAVTFCRKLGSSHVYQLNAELNIRVDNFALTIMQPGAQESTIELSLLANEDQRSLLSLLHSRWQEAQAPWNPELGAEIVRALQQTGEIAASL
jgi:hypothetical protein